MLDIAWPELMVIGAVALVAIGPKDLPKVMHTLGRWAGRARAIALDVQRSFDQLSYESEIAEKLKKDEEMKAKASPTQPSAVEHPPEASAQPDP